MEKLRETFRKNGLPYTLIKRTDTIALFGVGGEYYPDRWHCEIVKIYTNPDKVIKGRTIPARERITGNEEFGKDGSICVNSREIAEQHFEYLVKQHDASPKLVARS